MNVATEENYLDSKILAVNLFANDDSNESETNKENQQISNQRGFETVDKLLHRANIDITDLKPLVQNIYFGRSITNDDYKLFQVDQSLLDYLQEGNSLIIRGNQNENAVCCTESKTYSFKVAEVSNPLLLSTNITLPDQINQEDKRSIKKAEERPHLQKLKNLLEMNLYFGKTVDENCTKDTKKYRINDLLEIIQASEEEIYNYLNYIEAFQINGYWRLLDFGYYNKLLDDILKCIDDNSLSYTSLSVNDIYTDLQDMYGLSLLKQVVSYFFTCDESDSDLYTIKKEKLYKFYAESLLRSTLKMNYNEFVLILRKTLPNEFSLGFKLEYIQSVCYVEEPYIYYLNCLDMPDDIEQRFRYLFEKKPKWSEVELTAFVSDLCGNNKTDISNALTKYCRAYTQNGVRYFSTRM